MRAVQGYGTAGTTLELTDKYRERGREIERERRKNYIYTDYYTIICIGNYILLCNKTSSVSNVPLQARGAGDEIGMLPRQDVHEFRV